MDAAGPPSVRRRFSTGNQFLDRRVGGGIRAGSLLALVAPPGTGSQLLLRALAGARRTTYISTLCPDPAEVEREYLPPDADADAVYAPPSELLDEPGQYLQWVDPESYVVVDPFTPLEEDGSRSAVLSVLNALKRHAVATDGVAVVHCAREEAAGLPLPATLHRADTVWELDPEWGSRTMAYRLLVTKSRDGRAADEPVPLLLTDRVEIDTSWSI